MLDVLSLLNNFLLNSNENWKQLRVCDKEQLGNLLQNC